MMLPVNTQCTINNSLKGKIRKKVFKGVAWPAKYLSCKSWWNASAKINWELLSWFMSPKVFLKALFPLLSKLNKREGNTLCLACFFPFKDALMISYLTGMSIVKISNKKQSLIRDKLTFSSAYFFKIFILFLLGYLISCLLFIKSDVLFCVVLGRKTFLHMWATHKRVY